MRWFRFYDDAIDNAKIQRLKPPTFKHWINLLCLASKTTPRGTLPSLDKIAYRLQMKPCRMQLIMDKLIEENLLNISEKGEYFIHNWDSRQYSKGAVLVHNTYTTGAVEVLKCTDTAPTSVVNKRVKQLEIPSDTDTDTDTEEDIYKTKPQKRAPKNFVISEDLRAWAKAKYPSVDIEVATEEFMDHEYPIAHKDWRACWRTWIRNSFKFSGNNGNNHKQINQKVAGPEDYENWTGV